MHGRAFFSLSLTGRSYSLCLVFYWCLRNFCDRSVNATASFCLLINFFYRIFPFLCDFAWAVLLSYEILKGTPNSDFHLPRSWDALLFASFVDAPRVEVLPLFTAAPLLILVIWVDILICDCNRLIILKINEIRSYIRCTASRQKNDSYQIGQKIDPWSFCQK